MNIVDAQAILIAMLVAAFGAGMIAGTALAVLL